MHFDTSEIIDSNGQKYRVGWDESGWFSIQPVRLFDPHGDGLESDENLVAYNGERFIARPLRAADGSLYPVTSIPPDGAETVKTLIEEGL